MNPHHVFQSDWTWTGERFEPDVQITVDDNGRIIEVGRLGLKPTKRLSQRALLPGFVNAHSHAFQRGLRGRGEEFPDGAGGFWTWREAMYRLVQDLDGDAFYRLCLQTFREMRAAGITTVGEFHYLHHSSDAADFAFDALTLRAASASRIPVSTDDNACSRRSPCSCPKWVQDTPCRASNLASPETRRRASISRVMSPSSRWAAFLPLLPLACRSVSGCSTRSTSRIRHLLSPALFVPSSSIRLSASIQFWPG